MKDVEYLILQILFEDNNCNTIITVYGAKNIFEYFQKHEDDDTCLTLPSQMSYINFIEIIWHIL